MRQHWLFSALTLFALFCFSHSTYGQDRVTELEKKVELLEAQLAEVKALLQAEQAARTAAPPVPTPTTQPESAESVEEIKPQTRLVGPGGTLGIGGDIRFRSLYFDNLWDFDSASDGDQREVIRFRPRVYFDWKPTDNIEAYVRFTKEWFYGQDEEMPGYDVEAKDLLVDNAWGEFRNMFDTGLTLRVGRQDLIYGEGFVILDGTPFDGSQTTSFDAVKLSWAHDFGSTDFLYSKLHENDFEAADDEDFYGIYNKFSLWEIGLEPYLLARNKNLDALAGVAPQASNPMFDPSPEENTYLAGMRVTKSVEVADGVKLDLAAEGGKQWGKVDFKDMDALPDALEFSRAPGSTVEDRDAWGGLLSGTVTLSHVLWNPSIRAAFSYMSGDDPSTEDYEGWDDFYAQWPKYSELYVYTLYDGFKGRTGINDPDIGVWSNMMIPELMLTVRPNDKLTQSLRYLYFLAEEETGPGNGDERGHNLQWLTNYVFNANLSSHILVEWFAPGDYYADGADDALFARLQLMYSF
ncbi:MAG: alginate export family protein [bacterium]|jgi:hypothetical protein